MQVGGVLKVPESKGTLQTSRSPHTLHEGIGTCTCTYIVHACIFSLDPGAYCV